VGPVESRIESNVESTKVNSPFALLTNQVSLGVGQFRWSVWVVSLVEQRLIFNFYINLRFT